MVNQKRPYNTETTIPQEFEQNKMAVEVDGLNQDEFSALQQPTSINDNGSDDEGVTNNAYSLHRKRWFVLLSFSLLFLSNGWMWVTWSPLTVLVADYWNVSEGNVDALSGIYMYVFVPTSFVSMWLVVNHLGLSRGLLTGAILNVIGSCMRYLGASSYQRVYAGTVVCALAQTFILPTLPLISGNWFGAHERATATSLGALGYQTGVAMGLGSTIMVKFGTTVLDPGTLSNYLEVQFGVALLALLLVVCNVTSHRPPTPPSAAADNLGTKSASGNVSYKESVNIIVSNRSSVAFFIVFGLSVGVFYAIPTFLSQFVPLWPPAERGWLGGIFQLCAIVGCLAAGKMMDSFKQQYRQISIYILMTTIASLLIFSVATMTSQKEASYIAIAACGCVGISLSALMSVGIEFGTALTYPADEAAVYGVLDCTAELSGFVLVTIGGAMSVDMGYIAILLGILLTSLVVLLGIDGETNRPQQ